ncbi:MAG TPA: GNAT family N-acetyltransferase, partial [Micromonosporaceae bacterium]|nr:GNAT family N-acetyltransferase [Micromonosporaceae bacterium]
VPCMTLPLPYPWANQARPLALDGPVPAAVVREVAGWLTARSPQWTLVVRAEQPAPPGFLPWAVLPALVLRPPLVDVPPPDGVQVGPAASPAEFLAAYGVELAPLVTELHFASPYHRHLVARVGGEPAGCARVRFTGGTAYVSAVTVREPYRRKGLGAALSAAASRIGAAEADVVWLHATNESRPIYERLGYEYIDDHVLLVRQANSAK